MMKITLIPLIPAGLGFAIMSYAISISPKPTAYLPLALTAVLGFTTASVFLSSSI
ncbi:MAG: hypothetical protein WA667_13500 [Candidatus Nitrosopolaris sp.]